MKEGPEDCHTVCEEPCRPLYRKLEETQKALSNSVFFLKLSLDPRKQRRQQHQQLLFKLSFNIHTSKPLRPTINYIFLINYLISQSRFRTQESSRQS